MYDILLKEVHLSQRSINPPSASTSSNSLPIVEQDPDDVYYRFGGAILSEMLHLRYKSIKTCQESRRDVISLEITILQAINTKDKASMPHYLKYRDRGYMYSPQSTFIPFLRDVDECIKKVVNQNGFEEHKDDLIKVCIPFTICIDNKFAIISVEVAHAYVKKQGQLKDEYLNHLKQILPAETDLDLFSISIDNVYEDMVRKLCNIRIQEFLSSQQQKIASE